MKERIKETIKESVKENMKTLYLTGKTQVIY